MGSGNFKGLRQMRFEAVGFPDTSNGHGIGSQHFSHRTSRPVSDLRRRFLRRLADNFYYERLPLDRGSSTTRRILPDSRRSHPRKAISPACDRMRIGPRFAGDLLVRGRRWQAPTRFSLAAPGALPSASDESKGTQHLLADGFLSSDENLMAGTQTDFNCRIWRSLRRLLNPQNGIVRAVPPCWRSSPR
jgi:hypothetical protein